MRSGAKISNVVALGDSVGELAINLRKEAEEGHLLDATIITRDVDGKLGIQFTEQNAGELVEMGVWLLTIGQHVMAQTFEIPDLELEEEEPCEGD